MRRGGNLFLNKKALSDIVSTLLILLLVFVAVAILWLVVRNVIQQGTEQVSLGKFTLDLKIERVTVQTNSLIVKVSRNVGAGEFSGLTFIVDDGENTETIKVNNISMAEHTERTFTLTLPTINPQNVKTVEIAPIFTLSSGKEVVGDVKDTYEVSSSSSTTCSDTCNSLNYTCGTQTICGVSTSCGTCSQAGYVCSGGSCVLASTCNDTCSSLGYTCGTQTICGASTNCGTCATGQTCTSGTCSVFCLDTCSSLGYTCGTQTICGASTNCGTCTTGQVCNSEGDCVTSCTDTCTSLNYTCGTQTVCGASTNCGTCATGQTCSSGTCVASCTDTCTSLGYTCGTQTICGASTNCGTCATGQTCTSGTCVASTTMSLVYALNIGGGDYSAVDGTLFENDTSFASGQIQSISTAVAGTSDPVLYSTYRQGSTLSYSLPVTSGSYNIRFYFTEPTWSSYIGYRIMDVSVEGQIAIDNLDVYASSGSRRTAFESEYAVNVSDGYITISITNVGGDVNYAVLTALRIEGTGSAA